MKMQLKISRVLIARLNGFLTWALFLLFLKNTRTSVHYTGYYEVSDFANFYKMILAASFLILLLLTVFDFREQHKVSSRPSIPKAYFVASLIPISSFLFFIDTYEYIPLILGAVLVSFIGTKLVGLTARQIVKYNRK